jgi:hypothetical protein
MSRRALLARAAAVRRGPTDAQLLGELLEFEQLELAVDELALRSGALSPPTAALVRRIAAHERAHASALAAWPGVVAPAALGHADLGAAMKARGIAVDLGRARTDRQWLAVLEVVDTAVEGAYYAAIGLLRAPAAASLAATILASEAQHRALLSRQRYPHTIVFAVPSGLVHGMAPPSDWLAGASS